MRKHLSKTEIKELNQKLNVSYNLNEFFNKKDLVILEDDLIKKDNEIYFFYKNNTPIPSLKLLLKNNFLNKITVDMGAVKFVTNGADIMRPGILKVEDKIKKGDFIVIVDETHSKPLAVGKSLFNSEALRSQTSGKSVENIHYVGDELWNKN
ncbi:RNA-binding protein [Candidatus Woesearchaeota archaeon CG10_big_fil_rev_8_21_14_0_10_30_7]|nr:MAG: RNA-binding protein [Candidatus Woesearchaeota archaeon CG10_big_fil_rev_8_21_14_0_10_30_7]